MLSYRYLNAIGESRRESPISRGEYRIGMIDKRDGRETSSVSADSFSPLFARIAPRRDRQLPLRSHTESFIWKMYVPTSAPILRRMYLSWKVRSRARRRLRVSLDSEREALPRAIILIYGLSKYPASSWVRRASERATSTVFSDSEAAKNFIRWKSPSPFSSLLRPFLQPVGGRTLISPFARLQSEQILGSANTNLT